MTAISTPTPAATSPAPPSTAPAAPEETPAFNGRRIEGSVDHSTGDVRCDGDLRITGNVLDGRTVEASGALLVMGVVQAATITAGGDLSALGGISGRNKAECRVQGAVQARYITKTRLTCAGDVKVQVEILDSDIVAGGDVIIEDGALVGGQVAALGCLRCRRAGSRGAETSIAVGVDLAGERAAEVAVPELEARRKRAQRIRQSLEPLMQNPKTLLPQQKEKATELLYEASTLEEEALRTLNRLRDQLRSVRTDVEPCVRIEQTLCAGVQVRIMDVQAVTNSTLEGPLSLVVRGAGDTRRIVVVDAKGDTIDLDSRPVQARGAQFLLKLLAPQSPPSAQAKL